MKAQAAKAGSSQVTSEALNGVVFRSLGVQGVRATTGLYEGVMEGLSAYISRSRPDDAEVFRFPPVMSRTQIEASGYFRNFPNLLGCVSCLDVGASRRKTVFKEGAELDDCAPSDLVLSPSSCYPLYPLVAEGGEALDGAKWFDVSCDCFRREPSDDLDRLQSFRMREFVIVGDAASVEAFRDLWVQKAADLIHDLGLETQTGVANDPFFCPGASFLAASQRAKKLKYELRVEVRSPTELTACISFNYHEDHFGKLHDIRLKDRSLAHSACVGFGMDRLALALFVRHGTELRLWPSAVRERLQLA